MYIILVIEYFLANARHSFFSLFLPQRKEKALTSSYLLRIQTTYNIFVWLLDTFSLGGRISSSVRRYANFPFESNFSFALYAFSVWAYFLMHLVHCAFLFAIHLTVIFTTAAQSARSLHCKWNAATEYAIAFSENYESSTLTSKTLNSFARNTFAIIAFHSDRFQCMKSGTERIFD